MSLRSLIVSRAGLECFAVLQQPRGVRRSVRLLQLFASRVAGVATPLLRQHNTHMVSFIYSQLGRLLSVLNAAAKLLRQPSLYKHVTPMLRDHWLRSPERIDFKLSQIILSVY